MPHSIKTLQAPRDDPEHRLFQHSVLIGLATERAQTSQPGGTLRRVIAQNHETPLDPHRRIGGVQPFWQTSMHIAPGRHTDARPTLTLTLQLRLKLLEGLRFPVRVRDRLRHFTLDFRLLRHVARRWLDLFAGLQRLKANL